MKYLALLTMVGTLAAGEARYARLGEAQGTVEVQLTAARPWAAAERNLPLVESSWLRTGAESRVEVELDEGSVWRLGPDTRGALADYTRLSTGQRITLVTVDEGIAWFTGQSEGSDSLVLAAPGAQLTISRHSTVRVEVRDQVATIAVLSGVVRFSSPAATLDLREGQTTRVEAANPSRFFLFKEVAPVKLDGWNEDRDTALAATPSRGHVAQRFGIADLDSGEWVDTAELGTVWKPKAEKNWAPFRAGRWRWYDALGYTWVSDEAWGWLPYHFGRWALDEKLGWLWVPGSGATFKPGEVYWRRAKDVAGWGPLAPGEVFPDPSPEHLQPQQFVPANTTWAAFAEDADVIDPAGFTRIPKDAFADTVGATALPSPSVAASRLEFRRPLVTAVRVSTAFENTSYDATPVRVAPAPSRPARPTLPQPLIVVTQAPPPEPEVVEVPYAVPVGIPVPGRPATPASSAAAKPKAPAASTAPPLANHRIEGQREVSTTGTRPEPRRRMDEPALRASIVADLEQRDFTSALQGLDLWTARFQRTPLADLRQLHYMQAYDGLQRSADVLKAGSSLLNRTLTLTMPDAAHIVAVYSLLTAHAGRLSAPREDQIWVGATAAKSLLSVVPAYFTTANRPAGMTQEQWSRMRADLEALAKQTLAGLERQSAAAR